MTKKLICETLLVFWGLYIVCLIAPVYASHNSNPKAQQIICGDSATLIAGLEKQYGEKITEQGVDNDEHVLVVITASPKRTWSFLATPKGKPKTYCVLVTGTDWVQEKGISKGVGYDGSIVTVIFDEEGKWQLLFFNTTTKAISNVTTGYGWERVVDLDTWSH